MWPTSSWDALRALNEAPADAGGDPSLPALVTTLQAGCQANTPAAVLAHVNTESAARDMDVLRDALGEQVLNYYGASYGTWLGAVYSTLFPNRIRAFVLDSLVGIWADRRDQVLLSAAGYEDALSRFLSWCGQRDDCPFSQGDPDAFLALMNQLVQAPVPAGTRTLAAEEAWSGVTVALMQANWTSLESALAAVSSSSPDGTQLLSFADEAVGRNPDGSYTNFIPANEAIFGLDKPFPSGFTQSDFDNFLLTNVVDSAPHMWRSAAAQRLGVGWPVTRATPPRAISGAGAPPLLLLAGAHDPATPLTGGSELQTALGNGSPMLLYEGDGHGQAFRSQCMLQAMISFLLTPSPPPAPSSCADGT